MSDYRVSPETDGQNLDTNQRILTAQKLVQASYLKGANIKVLDELIADNATITYQVADQKRQRTKRDFLEVLQKIHKDNLIDVKFLDISCKAIGNDQVAVAQKSVHKRRGLGIKESGPGSYLIEDKAIYTFVDNAGILKVSKMDHSYTKTKID